MNSTTRIGLGIAAIIAAVVGTITTPPAHADQPYGGCKEAGQSMMTVTSQGADDCRAHGWTIRRTIVIDPHGWVRATTLTPCANDEPVGGPCVWDARRQGNGHGQSFWLDRHDTIHPVTGITR